MAVSMATRVPDAQLPIATLMYRLNAVYSSHKMATELERLQGRARGLLV
jgi:hypothetical protein